MKQEILAIQKQQEEIKKNLGNIKTRVDLLDENIARLYNKCLALKNRNPKIDACLQDIARIRNEGEDIYGRKN